jgi:hypothetical protein
MDLQLLTEHVRRCRVSAFCAAIFKLLCSVFSVSSDVPGAGLEVDVAPLERAARLVGCALGVAALFAESRKECERGSCSVEGPFGPFRNGLFDLYGIHGVAEAG